MADVPLLPVAEPKGSQRMALLSNALAIVGFIILFVIIVWGLFHIINLSGTSISSIFSPKPAVTVTAPKTAVSGDPVDISWKYTGTEGGAYSFLYQCQKDFAFATGVGSSLVTIPCGSAINVGSSTTATLVPLVSGKPVGSALSVPVTIAFATAAGKRIEGSATITVSATSSTAVPPHTNSAPSSTQTQAYPKQARSAPKKAVQLLPHAASGPADLSVRMILVGVIDPGSGALLPRAPISPLEIVGVEFDVANIGGTTSGTWYFTANLPTGAQPYPYTSPLQISLRPGEHIVNVLRFQPNMRPGLITVTVDPSGRVPDADRSNNTVSQQI